MKAFLSAVFNKPSTDELLNLLLDIFQQGEQIMGDLQSLTDAVVAEHAEVQAKLADLSTQIQALKDQLANGTPVTSEQFDALIAQVQGISEA